MSREVDDELFLGIKHQAAMSASNRVYSGLISFAIMALFKVSSEEQKDIIRKAISHLKEDTVTNTLEPLMVNFKFTEKQKQLLENEIDTIIKQSLSRIEAEMEKDG